MWLIISDIHIGDKHSDCNLQKLFSLLEDFSKNNYTLILNGDIFDFAKYLNFDERHTRFLTILQKFNNIIYIEGNHDWFVSGLNNALPKIQFKKELSLNYGNIKILHGHQKDSLVTVFSKFNRFLIRLNSWFYDLTGIDIQHYIRKTALIKLLINNQENNLMKEENTANILISGHTHQPGIKNKYGITCYNTGDWIEKDNCYYVIINNDYSINLIKA